MTDVSIKRNASGYYDETPYKAVFRGAQPGEIWKTSLGKEYLVVAAHNDNLYTVLGLFDQYKPDSMEITSRQVMYTNPAILQYMFGNTLSDYVKALSDSEFNEVVDAVSDALCITVKVNKVEDGTVERLEQTVDKQKEEMLYIRRRAEEIGNELIEVTAERDALKEQNALLMTAKTVDNDMAGMYQKMYYEVLDRLVMMAKG